MPEQELIPVSCQAAPEAPDAVRKHIMHYLFTKGSRYAADTPPEIRGFTSLSMAESEQITSVNGDVCYAVSVSRESSTTRVYIFHCKGESVAYVEEYETNESGLISR